MNYTSCLTFDLDTSMSTRQVVNKDLLTYLQELPPVLLSNIYQHSASCLAVFRELPELSRQYVMRMLFLEQPLHLTIVNSWARPDTNSQKLHREALAKLQSLHTCDVVPLAGGVEGIQLNTSFKTNLRVLICGGGIPWAQVGHTGEDKHARDVPFLDSYASKQWEGILSYMVEGSCDVITRDTVEILQEAKLMASSGSQSRLAITTNGFQFLLMDRPSQVWHFILHYLSGTEGRGLNLTECLTFIFQLSFMTLGKDYSTEGLTESQLSFMQHLRQFGLIYQRKRSSKRYYPTKLAITLLSGGRASSVQQQASGFIVLETNFKVVAYTDSPLQISILGLFCQLQYRFPNMVVGVITRESVHKALIKGITADQILTFIRLHAHPQMLQNQPIIPSTISDQVWLWEKERNRLETTEGVLYSEFLNQSDFETVKNYAQDLGVLLWSNAGRRLIVVSASGHDEVKRFWRRQSRN